MANDELRWGKGVLLPPTRHRVVSRGGQGQQHRLRTQVFGHGHHFLLGDHQARSGTAKQAFDTGEAIGPRHKDALTSLYAGV